MQVNTSKHMFLFWLLWPLVRWAAAKAARRAGA